MTAKKIVSRARKFLFARWNAILNHTMVCSVEAYDKDHAMLALRVEYPHVDATAWDFVDEIEPEHFVGAMGRDIPLTEIPVLRHLLNKQVH